PQPDFLRGPRRWKTPSEQAALPASRLRFRPCRRSRRSRLAALCARRHTPVAELDLQRQPRRDGLGRTQRRAVGAAHQREAAREHALVGIGGEQLARALHTRLAAFKVIVLRAPATLTERL